MSLHQAPESSSLSEEERDIKVYLTHTTMTSVGTSNWLTTVSSSDLVYDGTFTISVTEEWTYIEFDDAFAYDGSSNLMVTIIASGDDMEVGHKFYSTVSPGYHCIMEQSDDTPFTLSSLSGFNSGAGSIFSSTPNIRFYYTSSGTSWEWDDEMSYATGTYKNSVTSLPLGTMKWAAMFPAEYMTGRNYLESVYTYIASTGKYELSIYQGGDDAPEGSPIYTHTYVMTGDDGYSWNALPLYDVVPLNTSKNLWVVFRSPDVVYPAAYTDYTNDPNGSWYYNGTVWESIVDEDIEATWMITVATSATMPDFSAGIQGYHAASVGQSLTLTADGPASATYNWTLTGATPASATGKSVTFSYASTGSYNVDLSVSYSGKTASASHSVDVIECVNTLPFSEEFEYGVSPCWGTIDEDGDGHGWALLDDAHPGPNGSKVAMSESWSEGVVLTPDNWLVSPAITLDNNSTITLEWSDFADGMNYFAEHYAVMLSTGGTSIADFTTTLYESTINQSATWADRSASLSLYAGQTVHIAFRHFNCTDEYQLWIDDVRITAEPNNPDEVSITAPATAPSGTAVSFTAVGPSTGTYIWSFPGAATPAATGKTATATWETPGTYTVTLTAVVGSETKTATHTITITDANEVAIDAPHVAIVGHTVTFKASGPADGTYIWAFPSATPGGATGQTVATTWAEAGTYTVTLTAVIGAESKTVTHTITIQAADAVSIDAPATAAKGETVVFNAVGPADATYIWSFPEADAGAATGATASTSWSKEGVFTVTLTAVVGGSSKTATHTIAIGSGQGIADVEALAVTLAPNPTTGTVRVEGEEPVLCLEVYTLQGALVLTARGAEADLGGLQAGAYLVRIRTAVGETTRRVVKL